MGTRPREAELPREAITLSTYAPLELYLGKFAAGELGLVLLLGRHGTGKSESVKNALITGTGADASADGSTLFVEGHMQSGIAPV